MPQKLPVGGFKCVEETCQFNEDFMKAIKMIVMKDMKCDMNTELRKDAKNDFEKYFFKLVNKPVFGKNYTTFFSLKCISNRNEKNTDTYN